MAYIPALEKVQLGLESTYADGAAATVLLSGVDNCRIDPHVDAQQIMDKMGDTMPARQAIVNKRWSEGVIEGFLNYNQAFYYLDGMFGKATPVGTVRSYLASLDWSPEVEQSLAVYYGQTGGIFKATGVLPSELVISGSSGAPVRFSHKFFGLAPTDGASFAVVADPAPIFVMGSHCALAFDEDVTSNPGATALADTAFSFEFRITANRKPVWHLGEIAPDSYRVGKWGGSCRLVLEATTTTLDSLGDILDATVSPKGFAIRVKASSGNKYLQIEFVGQSIVPPVLIPDNDGIVTVELNLVPVYGSHASFLSCWGAELDLAA